MSFLARFIVFFFSFSLLFIQHWTSTLKAHPSHTFSEEIIKKDSSNWTIAAGIGLDLSALWLLNPRAGTGQNQLALGGVTTASIIYEKHRHSWQNFASFIFKTQKLGSGTIPGTLNRDIPFQKLVDELRLNSRYGFQSNTYRGLRYAADFIFQTQATASYGLENYLVDPEIPGAVYGRISKFLSPAILTLAPGLEYRFEAPVFLLFSPSALRMIMVLDDDVASLAGDTDAQRGLQGNPWRSESDYDRIDYQWGAMFKSGCSIELVEEALSYRSELVLFSNYLHLPQNLDIEWRNELAYQLVRGLALTANFNMYYDHDIPVLITDDNFPDGVQLDQNGNPVTGRRIFTLFQLNLQYNVVF